MRPANRVESVAVGQSHVQQDDVRSTFRKMNLGFTHTQEVSQFETVGSLLAKHLAQQTDITCIVFNKKDLESLFCHALTSRGNMTTESQKLSMLFTTVRNPSRPTGLVM